MRKTAFFSLATAMTLASCAPQALLVESEMRGPSESGIDLAGKTMAVVYLHGEDPRDTVFNSAFADGFASRLEEDYFNGSRVIDIFKMPYTEGAEYSSKDSLVNLVMDTGKDVVFLVDKPSFGEPSFTGQVRNSSYGVIPVDSSYVSTAKLPFDTRVFIYDSMGKEDKVYGFRGNKTIDTVVYTDGKASGKELERRLWKGIAPLAERSGSLAANSFKATWSSEEFYVIYYDGSGSAWIDGAGHAASYRWKEAIDAWLPLVDGKNEEKASCACYNIGLACFLMGQPKLALEWLDRSDSLEPVSLTKTLRLKIEQYAKVK